MKTIRIICFAFLAVLMTGCYSHRAIGYLQEPSKQNKLPVYDSVAYEPYRIRVNDEIIYRLVTLDETMSKMLGANNIASSGQYANPYRVYQDGTVELPFLPPLHVAGLTEKEAQDSLRAAFREIIPDADVKLALYNKYFSVIGDAHSGKYFIYKDRMNKPVVNGSVIMGTDSEGACSKHAALFECSSCSLSVDDVEQHGILGLGGDDDHVLEILRSGADE